MCNHELKRLFYTSDDDYDIQSCRVELEENNEKHTLSYCEKCGQVFVMEIAEKDKIRVGDEVEYVEDHRKKIVVTSTYSDGWFDAIDSNGYLYINRNPVMWKKTGRHFPELIELLKKMKEES